MSPSTDQFEELGKDFTGTLDEIRQGRGEGNRSRAESVIGPRTSATRRERLSVPAGEIRPSKSCHQMERPLPFFGGGSRDIV
jgi:hypothetical protein